MITPFEGGQHAIFSPQVFPASDLKPSKPFTANLPWLCLFTCVIGLGNFQTGFAISGHNQTSPVIRAKFDWNREEATLYNTLISSAAILGVVIGSLLGGKFI